jgi:phospholipid-binding lipoprotein MlaA
VRGKIISQFNQSGAEAKRDDTMKVTDRILIFILFILLVLCPYTFPGSCLAESVTLSRSSEPSISVSASDEAVGTIADPLEPVNRAFFHFNDKLYFWVLRPVAIGYKAVIPEDGRIGVHNFFSNLTTPVRLANCVFQANPKCAGTETLRFVLNTTIGVAGFFDPARKRFNLEKQDKDFGQTLGIWGMGAVFYIDLPILGPSSLRDGLGLVVDASLNPQTYLAFYSVSAGYANTGGWVLDKINEASLTLGEYEDLKEAALDPYIALREAYYQYRQNKITGSKLENGSANSNKINSSKQSTEFKELRKAEVITETPPLEPKMKKIEQIPSSVEKKLDSSVEDKRTVTVTWTFVIIRSGARNDYSIVTTVNQGDKLTVIGDSGEWFHVGLEGGHEGWVSNRVVK